MGEKGEEGKGERERESMTLTDFYIQYFSAQKYWI